MCRTYCTFTPAHEHNFQRCSKAQIQSHPTQQAHLTAKALPSPALALPQSPQWRRKKTPRHRKPAGTAVLLLLSRDATTARCLACAGHAIRPNPQSRNFLAKARQRSDSLYPLPAAATSKRALRRARPSREANEMAATTSLSRIVQTLCCSESDCLSSWLTKVRGRRYSSLRLE